MRSRIALAILFFTTSIPLGCSGPTTQEPVAPPVTNQPPPEKTDKGVSVSKKHTLPTAADPSYVSPGP